MLRDILPPITENFRQLSDGILLYYDDSRNKFLSTARETISFGLNRRNVSTDMWLTTIASIPSNNSSYKLPRNGTIVSSTIQTQTPANCTFHFRKNGIATDIYTLQLIGSSSLVDNNVNIDVDTNDWIQVFMSVQSGNVDYPVLTIEFAWRE